MVIDLASVLVFVVIGRAAHTHGDSAGGIASTAWPFLTGMVAGWLIAVTRKQDPATRQGGVIVWLSTVAVGMVLRVVAGQGTAFAFIVVALCFLGVFMLGARAVARLVERRRAPGALRTRT